MSHNTAEGYANETMSVPGFLVTGAGAGGGVANLGTLIVSDSTFESNQAKGASAINVIPVGGSTSPGNAIGGAIANLAVATAGVSVATAEVTNCQFTGNLAQAGNGWIAGSGAAGDALGGAIANFGPFVANPNATAPALAELAVIGSHFSGNQAIGGNDNSSPLLPGHSVGGAIASHRFKGDAKLYVSYNSSFDGNQSTGGDRNVVTTSTIDKGRAIPNMAVAGGVFVCGKNVTIINSTFAYNTAKGGKGFVGKFDKATMNETTKNGGDAHGGGIELAFDGTDVKVINCTVTCNWAVAGEVGAGSGGNTGNAWGGGAAIGHGPVAVPGKNPILTVTGGTIDNNCALGGVDSDGWGIGGGVYCLGTLTKDSVTLDPVTVDSATVDVVYNNYSSSNHPNVYLNGDTPSSGNDGRGGGLYSVADSTTNLNGVTITGNFATGEHVGPWSLVIVDKVAWDPHPDIWAPGWQAQLDNLITVLGRVRLDPALDRAAVYLNAARREFAAAANLVRAGRSASREERAKLAKEVATRLETARANLDQLVQAAGLPAKFPPRESGRSARAVATARQ
jgi:hypothetical protein